MRGDFILENLEIRAACMKLGKKQWEIAKMLGYSETHFSRKLRYELPPDEKKKMLAAIAQFAKEVNANDQ